MNQRPVLNELNILRYSVLLELFFGVTGILVAWHSQSQVVLLDGSYSFLCTLTMMANVRVSHMVKQSPAPKSPYGFAILEPLMLLFEGLILLGLCMALLSFAVYGLYTGGNIPEFDLALAYELFSTLISGITAIIFWLLHRAQPSPLIYFEFQEWVVDASLSAAATIAFTFAYIMGSDHSISPYIDPVLTLLLLLFLIRLPINTLRKNFQQLLLRDIAQPALAKRIRDAFSDVYDKLTPQQVSLKIIWLGRWLWVDIEITVTEEATMPTPGEMKAMKAAAEHAISSRCLYHRVQLSLFFPE